MLYFLNGNYMELACTEKIWNALKKIDKQLAEDE